MKVCSVCQRCYDDSITTCEFENEQTLSQIKQGNCLLVEGYRIEKQIESGSPVELYQATHLASEKSIIIRFIKTDESTDELRDELEAVANINHQSLARLYEFGDLENDEIYVVLENLEGASLRDYLSKTSPIPERNAIKIVRQLSEGLEELHDSEVLHRAVNPQNIFFTTSENHNFEVKLQNYDFGGVLQKKIVKEANGLDARPDIFQYFSPEQFCDVEINFKSDLYSLAIVFYELLLGSLPYNSINPHQIKNFEFNGHDVDGLHHDLRALLAYTLRESLQQRLHLRPRTTNNLVRQLRHLELIASPPGFVFQEKSHGKPKKEQLKEVSESFVPKNIENQPEIRFNNINKETVESEFVEEEAENSNIEMLNSGASESNKKIEKSDDEYPQISEEKTTEADTAELELGVVMENKKEADLLDHEVETITVSNNFSYFPSENENFYLSNPEIIEEIEEIKKVEKIDLIENEQYPEDIYTTREDLGEAIEQEIDFSEYVEVESFDTAEEFEYVEEQIQEEDSSKPQIMNSFNAYAQTNSFNRIPVYIAGACVAVLIVGFFVANSFDWSYKVSSSAEPKKTELTKKEVDSKKVEELIPEENPKISENNADKDLESSETDASQDEEKQEKDEMETKDSSEKSKEAKKSKKVKKSTTKPKAEKEKSTKKVANKSTSNKKSKPKNKVSRKKEPKKEIPKAKKSSGMTRPRIVPNVKEEN